MIGNDIYTVRKTPDYNEMDENYIVEENSRLHIENEHMSSYICELVSTCDHMMAFYEQKLLEQSSTNNSDIEVMSDYIWELIELNDKTQTELDLLNKAYNKQKIQIGYLQSQNERYQRTISNVTERWYGKIALKVYRFCKKIGLFK